MPRRRGLRGATPKQRRMYEKIKRSGRGRYGKRAKEVAARTVNKMKSRRRSSSRR